MRGEGGYCDPRTRCNAGKPPLVPYRRSSSGRPDASSPASRHEQAGSFNAVVFAEIGSPSAIARNEFWGRLRPPCAETAGARLRSRCALIVDEDLSSRRTPLRCEVIAVQQGLKVIGHRVLALLSHPHPRDGPSREGATHDPGRAVPAASSALGLLMPSCQR
jgi:hypothetical protein